MSKMELETSRDAVIKTLALLKQQLPKKLRIKEQNLLKNFKKDSASPIVKLRKLFAFIDELFAGFVLRYTPCEKGCSACCHIPVSISDLEMRYIRQNADIGSILQRSTATPREQNACPLLDNNVCSIYSVRPFVCRTHVTLDKCSYWCQTDKCDTVELPMLQFSEVKNTYQEIVQSSGSFEWTDIRNRLCENCFPLQIVSKK